MRAAAFVLAGVAVLAVAAPRQAPAQVPAVRKPDLKVRVLLKKEKIEGRWRVRMAFRVFNAGAVPAGPSTVGSWCLAGPGGPCAALDGVYEVGPPVEPGATAVVRLPVPAIAPGASVVVPGPRTREWPNGGYTIRAKADVAEVVDETIENNNTGQAAFVIP